MTKVPENFIAANKSAVDALLSVANTALAGAERIAALNLNTARSALEDGVSNAQALLSAKGLPEAAALQSSLVQPNVERAVSYSRTVYEIAAETQKQFATLVEAQFADFQKQVAALLDQATKNAPAGSDVAVSAVKSAFAAANSAFDNMTKAAHQIAEMTERNVSAAGEAAVAAANKTVAAAKK